MRRSPHARHLAPARRAYVSLCLVVACAAALGCHKPARRTVGDRIAAMRAKLATVVTPGAPGSVHIDVKALAAASRGAPRTAPPPDRPHPGEPEPRGSRARASEPPPQRDAVHAVSPPPASIPDPVVTRVDASRPTVFVLRGQTHGGQALCEQHATQAACTAACTNLLRASMLQQPEPGMAKHCACTEQDRGC